MLTSAPTMAMSEIANSVHVKYNNKVFPAFFVNVSGELHKYKSHSPRSLSQFCCETLGVKCPAVLQVIELRVVKTLGSIFRP